MLRGLRFRVVAAFLVVFSVLAFVLPVSSRAAVSASISNTDNTVRSLLECRKILGAAQNVKYFNFLNDSGTFSPAKGAGGAPDGSYERGAIDNFVVLHPGEDGPCLNERGFVTLSMNNNAGAPASSSFVKFGFWCSWLSQGSCLNRVEATGAMTQVLWVRTSDKRGGVVMSLGDGDMNWSNSWWSVSSVKQRQIVMRDDGSIVYTLFDPASAQNFFVLSDVSGLNDGAWHLLVVNNSPVSGTTLYVDGRVAGTQSRVMSSNAPDTFYRVFLGYDSTAGFDGSVPLRVPGRPETAMTNNGFNGDLGNFQLRLGEISAAEVRELWAATRK